MHYVASLRALKGFLHPFCKTNLLFKFTHDVSSISRCGFNDYEKERNSWNISIPEKFNFVSDVIDVWAKKEQTGERNEKVPAFWWVSADGVEVKWSFQNLSNQAKRTSHFLQHRCNVRRTESIVVMLPKVPEFWLVNLAAVHAGIVLCPVSMMLTSKDLKYRMSKLRPVCFIADEEVADVVDEACDSKSFLKSKVLVSKSGHRRERWLDYHQLQNEALSNHECADTRSDEIMMVFFTSGTTGEPKVVQHSHASYGIGHITTGKYSSDLTSANLMWNLSDPGWAKTAYSSIFAPWSCGAGVFVHEMPRFSAKQCLQILSKYPIDTFCGPPMAYRAMTQESREEFKFRSLRHCASGGEAVLPELISTWKKKTGLNIYSVYGQTEMVMCIGMYKFIEYRPGSLGKPNPALDVVILDEHKNEVGPGVVGEIAVRKRNGFYFGVFTGYADDPDKTARTLTDKYFLTGDLSYFDEDGYFWFVGRNDDLVNTAGYRIGPSEVENALLEHPAVLEVGVTSSPDEVRGEVVKAFIVLKEAYKLTPEDELIKELQEHTKKITAPYKYPRKIEFMEELPKTISGKIRRSELKLLEWKNFKPNGRTKGGT